jgi:hypothetical protein
VVSQPVSRGRIAAVSAAVAAAGCLAAVAVSALLAALKAARVHPEAGVDYAAAVRAILAPASVSDWVRLTAFAVVGLVSGTAAAAFLLARHGLKPSPSPSGGGRGMG